MNKHNKLKLITRLERLVLTWGLLSLVACGGGTNQAVDPTVPNEPIAYVKRPTPATNGTPVSGDLRDPEAFNPGAHLIVKQTASLTASEIDVTAAIIGDTGDVRDPAFSDDGSRLLFSLHRVDDNVDPPETWDLYEYDLSLPISSTNPRLLMDPVIAAKGNDIEPQFLANGDIIFSSSRAEKTRAVELDDTLDSAGAAFSPTIEATNSNIHAFNLHSMTAGGRGSDIRQLTYNMSSDFYPSLIRYIPGLEGRVLFSRWEHYPGPGANQQHSQMSLYSMNPDGTDVQLLYGTHSHNTGTNNSAIQFVQPHETANGDVLVLGMPFTGTFDGGDPTTINVSQYVDNTIPVIASSGLSGPAQTSGSNGAVVTSAGFSMVGRFGSVVPLLDGTNRALVSYSLCFANVTDPTTITTETLPCSDPKVMIGDANTTVAPPRYGIYVYNMDGSNTIKVITSPEPDTYFTDVALAQQKVTANYIPNTVNEDPTIEQTGILDIRSVYDLDGAFDDSLVQVPTSNATFNALCTGISDQTICGKQKLKYIQDPRNSTAAPASFPNLIERKPQFLRIVKGMYLPDDTIRDFNAAAFGIYQNQLMRQVIGYAPIAPDGSVYVKVPANVPFSISLVDSEGRRIGQRHDYWLSVRPGERLSCTGCHQAGSTTPHGRLAARFPDLNPGANGGTFPGINPAINPTNGYTITDGETMARVRSNGPPLAGVAQNKPSIDIVSTDIWTNPADRAIDSPYTYDYYSIFLATSSTSPANSACGTWDNPTASWTSNWSEKCRITINYLDNIQPIWERPRTATDGVTDVTCINCHNANGAGLSPFATQLDLSSSTSDINNAYITSYEELLNTDNQVDAMGADVLSNPADPTSTIPVDPPMSAGSAANSVTFFAKFASPFPGNTMHCTDGGSGTCVPWLNESELKLLKEWLDTGAQYYNNPFLAPTN